jgi:hypothetical protein
MNCSSLVLLAQESRQSHLGNGKVDSVLSDQGCSGQEPTVPRAPGFASPYCQFRGQRCPGTSLTHSHESPNPFPQVTQGSLQHLHQLAFISSFFHSSINLLCMSHTRLCQAWSYFGGCSEQGGPCVLHGAMWDGFSHMQEPVLS